MDKLLLSLPEFCQVIGVGPTLGKRLIRERKVESVLIGDRRLIPATAAKEYVERLRAEARDQVEAA